MGIEHKGYSPFTKAEYTGSVGILNGFLVATAEKPWKNRSV